MASLFKVVVCGQANVGKTCLLRAVAEPGWTFAKQATTIAVHFLYRDVRLADGRTIKLQLWDTAGQERFAATTTATYRGADVVIFVYDITNKASFDARERILKEALDACAAPVVVLVGAKVDLAATQRAVTVAEVEGLARARCYSFLETSALDRTGIDDLLTALANALAARPAPPPRRQAIVVPASTPIATNPADAGCVC